MKKRTAIITWVTYKNFGTFLQAYALQRYIISLGCENHILDDALYIKKHDTIVSFIKKYILLILSKKYRYYIRCQCKSGKKYEQFKRNSLIIDNKMQKLSALDAKYDVFICGSDQIWNPLFLKNKFQDFYYASFTSKPKIAYAPSLGIKRMPEECDEKMRRYVQSFTHLSSREIEGCRILNTLVGREVAHVVDPTLLLDSCEWNSLVHSSMNTEDKEKYVLLYFLTYNKTYINVALNFAKSKRMNAKIFFIHKEYYSIPCDKIEVAGPLEFLAAIQGAQYVFTDSFHGSIFSYIFKTQFFTFKRFNDGLETNQNSRVENLLFRLGIPQYLIGETECNRIFSLDDIDFKAAERQIAPFIESSKSYLQNALNNN